MHSSCALCFGGGGGGKKWKESMRHAIFTGKIGHVGICVKMHFLTATTTAAAAKRDTHFF
jgi:hypothetical protein